MSAESKVAAPVGGMLAEVLALLAKATPGEWRHDRYAPCNEGRTDDPDLSLWADIGDADEQFIANIAFDIARPDDCDAICAAVNYLRSHGPAVAELVEALERCRKALREARGGIFDDAAMADRAATTALARVQGGAA